MVLSNAERQRRWRERLKAKVGLQEAALAKALKSVTKNADGKIIPDPEAIAQVERDYPRKSNADKFRLAQAVMLLRFVK